MDLEQIPEITEIARYIENMEFRKKALGGIDEESAMEHISIISNKYEQIIRSLTEEKEHMNDIAREIQNEYQKKSEEIIDSMSQINEYREHVLKKAEEEATGIVEEARARAAEIEKQIEQLQNEYLKKEQEYKKKTEELKKEGAEFCADVREILTQIENLNNGTEE